MSAQSDACKRECANYCPHQGHRKETCPLKKEDFECHEHEMVVHRIAASEKAVAEIEERDTERKMINHRLKTLEDDIKESDFARKSDISSLERKIDDKMEKSDLKNEAEHKEFKSFNVKIMVMLAMLSSGSTAVLQYFLF